MRDEQNRIRGAIAKYRSRGFSKVALDRHSLLIEDVKRCLMSARAALYEGDFDRFLKWADNYISALVPPGAVPVYAHLSGILQGKSIPLEREARWVLARLAADADVLGTYRSAADNVEELILKGSLSEVEPALDGIASVFGESFWSIELRFAVRQLTDGLEGQKKYLAELRSLFKQGLLSFVAYHVSARNEAKTTSSKFRVDTLQRIVHRTSYQIGTQHYLQFRLMKETPGGRRAWADILRCEQSGGLIDLYETFVAFCQNLESDPSLSRECVELLSAGLRQLASIGDPRLSRLSFMRSAYEHAPPLAQRTIVPEAPLFAGNAARAYRAIRRSLSRKPREVWQIVYAGAALAASELPRSPSHLCLGAVELLGAILGRTEDAADALARLDKVTLNFANLPTMKGLSVLVAQFADRRHAWQPDFTPVSQQASSIGPEDVEWEAHSDASAPAPEIVRFWRVYRGSEASSDGRSLFLLARALNLVSVNRPGDAIEPLDEVLSDEPHGAMRELALSLLLSALSQVGDRQKLIALVGQIGTRGVAQARLLPTAGLIGTYQWDDFRQSGLNIRTCNALHLLWQDTGDEKVASWLRFATSQVLKQVGRPSTIVDGGFDYPRHELVYFLREVCVPGIMDISRIFKSSREVLEERREVLGALLGLDNSSRDEFQQQILSITNQLTLDDGLTIVDRSRIYVDADSFRQWAKTNIEEDFQRYHDLIKAGIGTGANFDEVMRLLTTDPQAAKAIFFTPDNQADALLLDMLRAMRDAFLTNTTFGFDYYLSKRIRHQSFVGLIRGPLEFANLITTRETERSDYNTNDSVLASLSALSPEQLSVVSDKLSAFSQSFDETLAALRDSKLQVRSSEKPEGIFEVPLTAQVLVVARSIAQVDRDVGAFADTALAVFWGAIEVYLAVARKLISVDIKNAIAALIDQLRIELRAIAGADPGFVALDTAFGRASLEVQRNLDGAAGWFTRENSKAAARYFTLPEALEIAIESARKSQRSFEAEITRDVSGDVRVPASGLILITEVIFVALDNVRRHSRLHATPHIDIRCSANLEEGFLDVEVLSDASDRANGPDEAKRLAEIAALVERNSFEKRAKREGGSGFIKLAAVAKQSNKGAIEFGFVEGGRFRLFVRYSLLVATERV